MDRHNKLFVDNWFKLPPKEKLNSLVAIKIVKKGTGKRHAKKSRQSPVKKESQKRG